MLVAGSLKFGGSDRYSIVKVPRAHAYGKAHGRTVATSPPAACVSLRRRVSTCGPDAATACRSRTLDAGQPLGRGPL